MTEGVKLFGQLVDVAELGDEARKLAGVDRGGLTRRNTVR